MDTVIRDPYREAIRAATGLDAREAFRHNDKSCWPEFEVGAIDEATFARRYFAGAPHLRFDLEAFHRGNDVVITGRADDAATGHVDHDERPSARAFAWADTRLAVVLRSLP